MNTFIQNTIYLKLHQKSQAMGSPKMYFSICEVIRLKFYVDGSKSRVPQVIVIIALMFLKCTSFQGAHGDKN